MLRWYEIAILIWLIVEAMIYVDASNAFIW